MQIVDGFGTYGYLLAYGLTAAMVLSSVILFIYCWSRGRLDFDESVKDIVLEDE